MGRSRTISLVVIIAVVAVGLGACSSSGGGGSKTLTFKTVESSFTAVPVSGQSSATPQPGDYVVITDNFMDGNKVVGHDNVHCTLITTKSSLCNIGVQLPKGELTLQGIGPAGGTGSFSVAITGGTGSYDHARGTVHFRSTGSKTGMEVFHIAS